MALRPLSLKRRCKHRTLRRPRLESLERRDLLTGYTTPEDTPLVVNEAVLVAATIVTRPAHGELTLINTGGFKYSPALNYNGPDGFAYRVGTATGTTNDNTEPKKVEFTVTPVNDRPVAEPDGYLTQQNSLLVIAAPGVLKNDHDVDSEHLFAKLGDKPLHGTLELKEDGSFTYKPVENYAGDDAFTYRASDGDLSSEPAKVNISVRPAPIARPDQYGTNQNTVLVIAAPGVLGNDTGVNGRSLTASVEKNPEHGTLELKGDGSFTYKPAENYTGPDSFIYRATDNSPLANPGTTNPLPPASSTATVYLYVRPTPAAIANPDVYTTMQNTALGVEAPGVLKNDYVIYGDPTLGAINGVPGTIFAPIPLAAKLLTEPSHGKLELQPNGSFKYVPAENFSGSDTFVYRAVISNSVPGSSAGSDSGEGESNSGPGDGSPIARDVATVTIYVKPSPIPPEARDDFYRLLQGTTLAIAAPGVLGNDSGPAGHTLAAELGTGPSNGELTLNRDGSFKYTPKLEFSGYDSFTYRAVDTNGDSTTPTTTTGRLATVTLYVQALHPPVYAYDDAYKALVDTTLTIEAPGVLGNDSLRAPPVPLMPVNGSNTISTTGSVDGILPDNWPFKITLSAALLDKPAHGTLTLKENGSFEYKPEAGFAGEDKFTYKASATAGYWASDGTTAPGNATTSASAIDSMPCRVTDDGTETCPPVPNVDDIATVTIFVRRLEPAVRVVAKDDRYVTSQNTPIGIAKPGVLANDYVIYATPSGTPTGTTADNGARPPLTAVLVAGPSHGKLELVADGSFKYLPAADFAGTDTFTYQASLVAPTADPTVGDGSSSAVVPPILSNIATVTITVAPILAQNDTYSTVQDTTLAVEKPGVLKNDTGGTNDHPLVAVLMAAPVQGTLDFHSDGSFKYAPPTGFTGPVVFVYRATSGPATGTTATTLDAAGSNDPGSPPRDVGVVTIYVTAPRPVIEAKNDFYSTPKDKPLDVAAPGVLGNDSAPAGVKLTASLIDILDRPSFGQLKLNADGSFRYEPATGFVGEDKFAYRATASAATTNSNGELPGAVATITIYVRPTEPEPRVIVGGEHKSTDESGLQNIPDWVVSPGDESSAAPPKIVVSSDHAELFSVPPTIDASGRLVYMPAANASGAAEVRVEIQDENGDVIETHSFTIQVEKPHPLYNTANPRDVSFDKSITALDALLILNYLNSRHRGDEPAGESGSPIYYDVSADNVITPLDTLLVLNYLNSKSIQSGADSTTNSTGGSTTTSAISSGQPSLDDTINLLAQDTEADRRRRGLVN